MKNAGKLCLGQVFCCLWQVSVFEVQKFHIYYAQNKLFTVRLMQFCFLMLAGQQNKEADAVPWVC